MNEQRFSRRSFVMGAGFAAGTLGLVGAGIASQPAAATQTVDDCEHVPAGARAIAPAAPTDQWDAEADVVVVGTGGAGGAATVAALEEGARVITLEKNSIWGGNIQFSGVWGAPNVNNPEAEVRAQEVFPGPYAKKSPIIMSILAHRAADDIAWMQQTDDLVWDEMYLQWACYKPAPKSGEGSDGHYAGKRFANAFQTRAEELGADIRYETPAVALIQDGAGAVVGVCAQQPDGTAIRIRAKAVVLACGGYTANPEMLEHYMRPTHSYEFCEVKKYCGLPGATGDGIRMAQGLGAWLRNMNEVEIWDGGVDDPVNVNGPRAFYSCANQLNRQSSLSVNILGKRFMNEARIAGDTFGYQARIKSSQPKATCFTIFDATCISKADVIACFKPSSCEVPTEWWDYDFEKQLASGLIMQADSLEELAQMMEVPADTFLQTVETYNAACDAGYDDVFFKDPGCLHPLRVPPFYATKGVGGSALHTHGGVVYDENLSVVTPDGLPIAGLYAAGETASYLNGIARIIQSGRYAGQNAGRYALDVAGDEVVPVENPTEPQLVTYERAEGCFSCHGSQDVRLLPDDHAGRTLDTCLTCHDTAMPTENDIAPAIPHNLDCADGVKWGDQ